MDNGQIIIQHLYNKHFNKELGFGKYKDLAIKLLKETIQVLDEFEIDYFLISGTLLGYVRHNDFIPWDDDIDLIVDSSILEKMPEIIKKHYKLQFLNVLECKWILKTCYNMGVQLEETHQYNWTWPFVDLFVYTYDSNKKHMNFFNKQWITDKFFPIQKGLFLGFDVVVPKDPDYFLQKNYGNDYMKVYKSNTYSHKYEKLIGDTVEVDSNMIDKYMK